MRRWSIALAGIVVLAFMVAVAAAQPPEGPPRHRGDHPGPPGGPGGPRQGEGFHPPRFPLMVALDKDKDGQISAEEIAEAAESLKTLDKNQDGKLDRQELRPQFAGRGGPGRPGGGPDAAHMVQRLMRLDTNGDGKVDKEELPERMQRILKRGDTNGDGAIDKEEAEAIAEHFRHAGPPQRGRHGKGGPRPEGGHRHQPPPQSDTN